MANGTEGTGTKLGNQSWVSFGLLLMAVGGAISLTWFMATFKASFDTANVTLASVDKRLENVEKAVSTIPQDIWTGTDMKLYMAEVGHKNPTLDLPVPAHEQR